MASVAGSKGGISKELQMKLIEIKKIKEVVTKKAVSKLDKNQKGHE